VLGTRSRNPILAQFEDEFGDKTERHAEFVEASLPLK
jgi:hypothetical protein